MSTYKIDYRTKLGQSIKAAQALTKAMHSPDFSRQFWCWARMQGEPGDLPPWGAADDAGYCLDRTEAK